MKSYKFLALMIVCLIFMVGCTTPNTKDNNGSDDSQDAGAKLQTDSPLLTADKVMEYYGISEDEVPKSYITAYLMEYRYRENALGKWDLGTDIRTEYSIGKVYGTDVERIFLGEASDLPLDEFMQNADVIVMDFGMYNGGELCYPGRLSLDLKNQKIYYTTQNKFDYTDAEKCADLTDEDVQSIRDELPKHISQVKDEVSEYTLEYTFTISMKDPEYNVKYYYGNSGDEHNFPGFDKYWKDLYKRSFNEEFVYEY